MMVHHHNIDMNFNDLLLSKAMPIQKLSTLSGIPRATITDIAIGRTDIKKTSGIVLYKISKALNVSMEELIMLDSPFEDEDIGVKIDKSYLELNLNKDCTRLIKNLKLAIYRKKDNDVAYYKDCIYENILSDYRNDIIDDDTYRYIVDKYLKGVK